jgi:outer membrane protein TolC
MHRMVAVLLAISVSGFGQPPVQPGQTAAERSYPEVVAPPRVGISLTQTKLSLAEAIQMALANNLDVQIDKTNVSLAEENVMAARGFYDPNFRWVPAYNLVNNPTGSVLQGSTGVNTDRTFGMDFYYKQMLPKNGTSFHVDFLNNRATTTNPFSSFVPAYQSRLVAAFSQPLLRNRATDQYRTELQVRQKQVSVSKLDFETRVIDIVAQVQTAYWNLAAARADAEVNRETAGQAQEQLAINRRMVAAGTVAPVELAASEAELERRLDSFYASLEVITQVENQLKTLLAKDRSADIWRDEIIPTDRERLPDPKVEDVSAAMTAALERRPELKTVAVRQEINDLQKNYAHNQTRPQIDIVGQYLLTGFAGTPLTGSNPFTDSQAAIYDRLNYLSAQEGLPPLTPMTGSLPEFMNGGYGTNLANLFGGRYQSFQAGISLDLTIRNRTANANYAQTLIAERRLKLEEARAEQLIEAQVRNALQGIASSRQRIAAGEASVKAAREKLESETRLYQTGESTNFLVLTRQNELADSRRRYILAMLDFNKSIARLQQAVGNTLAENRIVLP